MPDSYKFAFLEWMRGLKLEFTLSPEMLQSRVELRLRHPDQDGNLHIMPYFKEEMRNLHGARQAGLPFGQN